MDTSLDNANNPFANSNGADNNIIAPQKTDGLLLNLSENFKHNGGADLSPSGDFYHNSEKANGKRLASEFDDDDDLGPETDVDAVDDVLSPSIVAAKALAEGIVNNNPDGSFNPFVEKDEVEKAALEIDLDLQKQQSSEFDGQRSPREETPTPPADAVHDGGLEDNVGDSGEESEDEWNYIKGEEANKENISPSQPDCEVADLSEEPDNMSQLNPNAAEFVPVSPTRSIPSPACVSLINDPVIAQSPKRPSDIDISLPNPQDFEKEVKSRPSDFDAYSNGHDHDGDQKQESMENLLNGKNIDDIPEFQPGSTPTKAPSNDEFHFGPNAAPFTPAKLLDQSEAALSTKAEYGDESVVTLDTTFEISTVSKDNVDFVNEHNKENDPMSMSFYQENTEGEDLLNKVQVLPENLDDFLNKSENRTISHDDTVSNVQDNEPAIEQQLVSDEILLNNDERIQTTDLDKIMDDEKELASPVSNEEDIISGICELSKSPCPEAGDLIENLECDLPKETLPVEVCSRPESKSPQPELMEEFVCSRPESKSPRPAEEELLKVESPEPELLSPEPATHSPQPQTESPAPVALSPEPIAASPAPEVLSPELTVLSPVPQTQSSGPENEPESELVSPALQAISPEPQISSPKPETKVLSPEPETRVLSPELETEVLPSEPESKVLSPEPETKVLSPEPETKVLSPEPELEILSPEPGAKSPVAQVSSPEPSEELCQISKSPAPLAGSPQPTEDVCLLAKSPEPEKVASPLHEQLVDMTPEPVAVTEQVGDICKLDFEERKEVSIESPVEDVTSSVKDVASPVESPIPDQIPVEHVQINFAQEVNTAVQSVVTVEASSPIKDDVLIPDQCPISTPISVTDTESVNTADINSFLERSGIADLASPMSPNDQPLIKDDVLDPTHPLMTCVYPLPTDIKTETITPEFAEPTMVVSPTEETKEETPSISSPLDETVKEEEPVVEKVEAPKEEITSSATPEVIAAVGTAAAVAAVATAAATVTEKKPTVAKAKAPATKKAPAKPSAASPTKAAASPTKAKPSAAAATKARLSATSSKPATTAAAKTASTTLKPPVTKTAPKPKTPTATSKTTATTEKKPLSNGDVKAPIKSSLTARKSTENAKTASPKPATAASKTSPTKPTAPRPTTASTKPATTRTSTATAPKPRPSTLVKTSTSTATKTATSTASARATASKTTTASPKPTSPPKPRPATAPAKPKAPLTKTVMKSSADTEKQIKETANKLTASRTVTSSRSSTLAAGRTVTSTVRKTESKTTGATRTTVTKTTTTTTRPGTAGKKPAEITRTTNKTKVTKVEKPVQNGVSTVVTEQLTTVNNAVNESDQQLMKDNSPIDNKLIVETNAAD